MKIIITNSQTLATTTSTDIIPNKAEDNVIRCLLASDTQTLSGHFT
jgi:hypothetical protein